ncbi:MAG: redoxin domain-containing protein [Candidatus Omnitrophica bacterium]|nr:redoxin domain-containing protein [Candidatus Omnitrophota bacterium]
MKKTTFMIILGGLTLIIAWLILIKPPKESKKEAVFPEETPQKITVVKKTGFKLAPEFSLKDINGAEKKLSDFKGKVVIIDFWATWCPPCRNEIPHFVSLYNQYKGQGLEIIGVALDQNPGGVLPGFIKDNSINYIILVGNNKVSDLYGGISAIPTTFIIDRNGNIIKKYIGYNEREVFESQIKELL